jgi:addiction module HigA family antidote
MMETRTMSKSSTTTMNKRKAESDALLPLVTPGEILLEEFLKPMSISQNAVARAIHVPPRRINEIVLGQRSVTADTDLRLSRYFGMSEGFFLGLQTDHDLRARKRDIAKELSTITARVAAE